MAVLRPDPSDEEQPSARDALGSVRPVAAAEAEPASTADLYPEAPNDRPGWHVRLFGSHEFFRLWLVQVVSATGDWLGFSAIILLASRVGEQGGAGAISLVMAARIIPGFFFAPLAGVLVDRWDRKRVMVVCDVGRAGVIASLPFVDNLFGLVMASLVLEVFTLLWTPAKDATVPRLVPQDHLTTANSLSLAAAYGTFPFASLLFALLAGVSTALSEIDALSFLQLDQMSLAFYVDVLTFLFSALMISTLPFPAREPRPRRGRRRVDLSATFRELKEGWHYIFLNPTVRAVNIGLATGLIGGGMLIPLGAVFSTEVLDAGAAGYGLFTTALGFGVATGVLLVSTFQKRLPKAAVFTGSLFAAGISLFLAASTSSLGPAAVCVFVMGMSVGPVYVLGFVLLQEETEDELRGRVFASLSTLVRLCVLVSMIAGPLVAAFLGGMAESLTGGEISIGSFTIAVPGVRLALWLGALIIVIAGFLTRHSVRSGARDEAARVSKHPSRRHATRPEGPGLFP